MGIFNMYNISKMGGRRVKQTERRPRVLKYIMYTGYFWSLSSKGQGHSVVIQCIAIFGNRILKMVGCERNRQNIYATEQSCVFIAYGLAIKC